MSGKAAAQAASATADIKLGLGNPDRVGEELADDANIWHVYDRVAREDDERRTKAWDNGLNNLALFAGLFSAVTTAFIVEARHDMEPDYAQLTFLVLNATVFGEKPVHQPFVVPSGARTVNCLWVSSLVLSLTAALIAIMGKDWIGMYTARPVCNLRQWAEMRTYRLHCVERWYMSGVIASAPVLLHISLLLFGAGLVLFMSTDPFTHHLTLGISLAAGALYLVTTFSAVVFSASPFKSPATQMLRAALAVCLSYLRNLIRRPKRNLVRTLLDGLNLMIVGHTDDSPCLPASAPDNCQGHSRRSLPAVFSSVCRATVAYLRLIPISLRGAWLRAWSRLCVLARTAHRLPVGNWFLSSAWNDLPTGRRPSLVAEALSWLNGASPAPDVFRAIMFALGDLEIGPEVGQYTSVALRTRLRAEIRRTWKQANLLTLSRYVLADRNTPGDPVLYYGHLADRFDPWNHSTPRCEDGFAAVIRINPRYMLPRYLAGYHPEQVTQPRMPEFLLPYIQRKQDHLTDALILVLSLYRSHLQTTAIIGNLEAGVYESLDAAARQAYATTVNEKYGGRPGIIELLTFLCCRQDVIEDVSKAAAVDLIMELLDHFPFREHRCLVYLLGGSDPWQVAWQDKGWPPTSIWRLFHCLESYYQLEFQPDSVSTQSDKEFTLALARTSVMVLSPQHDAFVEAGWIEHLYFHLCASSSRLDADQKLRVIHLILDRAALLRIVGNLDYSDPDGTCLRISILEEIIRELGRRLRDPVTVRDGERLFAALAWTEFRGARGNACIWDLGQWLHTQGPAVRRYDSPPAQVKRIHDALDALHPLCWSNDELRFQFERIGYHVHEENICPGVDVGYDDAPSVHSSCPVTPS